MSTEKPQMPQVTNLKDGSTNFEGVSPDDLVAVKPARPGSRGILMSAGLILNSDRQPIGPEDGAHTRLDGGQLIKLGGVVIASAEANPPRE